jgi:predicted thioesterase
LNDKWHNIIAWAELNWTSKTLEADYCRLGLSVAVYHIWAQRNAILHHGYVKTVEQIVNIIRKQVKMKIESVNSYPSHSINTGLCARWVSLFFSNVVLLLSW